MELGLLKIEAELAEVSVKHEVSDVVSSELIDVYQQCRWENSIYDAFAPQLFPKHDSKVIRYSDIYVNFEVLNKTHFIDKWNEHYIGGKYQPIEAWYDQTAELYSRWKEAGSVIARAEFAKAKDYDAVQEKEKGK
jgi:hypothetical protein